MKADDKVRRLYIRDEKNHPRAVITYTLKEVRDGMIDVTAGASFCSHKDSFDRKKGFKLAELRRNASKPLTVIVSADTTFNGLESHLRRCVVNFNFLNNAPGWVGGSARIRKIVNENV